MGKGTMGSGDGPADPPQSDTKVLLEGEWVGNNNNVLSSGVRRPRAGSRGRGGGGMGYVELPYNLEKLEEDELLMEGVCKGSCSFLVSTASTILRSGISVTRVCCKRAILQHNSDARCHSIPLMERTFSLIPIL